ncbi:GYDIA family GHMP kinase [Flavobacterium sp.]|uniref:GYDIA family GHMP kinase n=1 Tax=Flavobacterium sp. TaxID=239 RepID=UPI00262DA4D7|nr:GYDIA family GHMP kinase [Flavobacterium sp.]
MKQTFYSNGKLLITSEYLVLDGAKALALPTKFGQDLIVEPGNDHEIQWTSYDDDGSFWFEDTFTFDTIKNKTAFENQPVKTMLIAILHEASVLNPDFLKQTEGYIITTRLTFPKFWGLGTSSTLINNIAQWLQIDPYTLLSNTFGGSGYDIACAQNNTPIVYQRVEGKPIVSPVTFLPECASNIYFVYLNQKQNSKSAIAAYRSKSHALENLIPVFDELTDLILQNNDYDTLSTVLKQHEKQMSEVLDLPEIQKNLFPDFNGVIKSLGAWGGDFVMVLSKENPSLYFRGKGYDTIVPYTEMIL